MSPNPANDDILVICARVKAGKPEPGDVETLALWCEKQAEWLRRQRDKAVRV